MTESPQVSAPKSFRPGWHVYAVHFGVAVVAVLAARYCYACGSLWAIIFALVAMVFIIQAGTVLEFAADGLRLTNGFFIDAVDLKELKTYSVIYNSDGGLIECIHIYGRDSISPKFVLPLYSYSKRTAEAVLAELDQRGLESLPKRAHFGALS